MAHGRNLLKVAGEWKYLYRAVNSDGHTIDFLLRAKRDCAARCFLECVIDLHGVPEKIAIDKSDANTAAIKSIQTDSGADIEIASDQVFEQYRRTGPPGHQTHRATHAGVRNLSLCLRTHCGH